MKRILTLPLALLTVITCCLTMASATNNVLPRASLTLTGYAATMKAGSTSGELRISYDVAATMLANKVGVSEIKIYKANGTCVATITGSTSNGLVRTSYNTHKGTYSYFATPGTNYYAVVTVFAETSTAYDSRDVTTVAVKAP